MSTGNEHYAEAERMCTAMAVESKTGSAEAAKIVAPIIANGIALAQVHATLAVAAHTAALVGQLQLHTLVMDGGSR